MRDHRLQHLSRDDHRHLRAAGLADDLLLDVGHVLKRYVHAEVAARDHDRIDLAQDARKIGDDLVTLELGDDRQIGGFGAQERSDLVDVLGRAHERDGYVVDPVAEPESQVVAILRGQAGYRQGHARQREPLVVADPPADRHATAHLVRRRRLDLELDHPVVHPDLVAGAQIPQILGMVDRRPLDGADDRMRAQREGPAGLEVDAAAAAGPERPQPDLRALQILKDRDRPAPARLAVADAPYDVGVLLVGPVREVEPRDVEARRHQAIELGGVAARGTDRADDLGPPHRQEPASYGLKNCPVYERSARLASSSGVPVAATRPPSSPPSGPRSITQSAVFTTSRLCSMITTVLPCSTSLLSTSSRRWMSAKCRPVVGSSRMYRVRPVARRESSVASFTRWASPPDRVVAD